MCIKNKTEPKTSKYKIKSKHLKTRIDQETKTSVLKISEKIFMCDLLIFAHFWWFFVSKMSKNMNVCSVKIVEHWLLYQA